MRPQLLYATAALLVLLPVSSGCRRKLAVAPPAPPPPPVVERTQPPPVPAAPVISEFVARPNNIDRGSATTLRWTVQHASIVTIEPAIGSVSVAGSRAASPQETTTYTLNAKGPGGQKAAAVKVTVNMPPPPVKRRPSPTISQRLSGDVVDAYFDFDKSNIRRDAREILIMDASALNAILKDFPDATIIVEGHCDERGSAEYNLALGDRRATVTREFLQELGVAANRLSILSLGKERPQCTESTEDCWQKNRRIHFSPGQAGAPATTTTSQRIP